MKRISILALLTSLAIPAVADAATYRVARVLKDDLQRVGPRTDIAIRVPFRIGLDYDKGVFGEGSGSKNRYTLEINAADDCGANVCFLAQFQGEKGGEPSFTREVDLAKGITGYYKPLSCGGSCSPPMIEWVQGGVLYSIQAKTGVSGRARQRRAMIANANSAIRARPR
ncbi:MAG TPA: hypothetical protein VF587_18395 [Solirubrobacteraceae bacterium]|jgi:hypothetical protein